jgi:hypothetical protein
MTDDDLITAASRSKLWTFGTEHLPSLDDAEADGAMIRMLGWRLRSINRHFSGGFSVCYQTVSTTDTVTRDTLGRALAEAIVRCSGS